jgi:predicted nucleotidyltransferase
LWKEIDDDSDIDVVIISEKLFDYFWEELFKYNVKAQSRTEIDEQKYAKFLEYFFKGWLRPDYFPFKYRGRAEWLDFFGDISYKKYDNRKVTCGLFKNEFFLRDVPYQKYKKIKGY